LPLGKGHDLPRADSGKKFLWVEVALFLAGTDCAMNGFSRLRFVKNAPANPNQTCRLLCLKMSNIEHISASERSIMWW
jgi:hypothetical protein